MTPAEQRTAAIKLLAEIDQVIAKYEELALGPVLSYDEEEFLAIQLEFQRRTRTHVEQIIKNESL